MPKAFTEAFVAVIFFHESYRGAFMGDFLKLPWKIFFLNYSSFIICFHGSFRESFRGGKFTPTKASMRASVKASVEAHLLPRKLP